MNRRTSGTVTHLPPGMDSPWTAEDKWTNLTSCPHPAHTCLGQAIKWTSALTTDTWITAQLDAAVTHTDPDDDGDKIYFFFGGKREKRENDWTKTGKNRTGSLHETEHRHRSSRSVIFDSQDYPWQETQERRFAPIFFGSKSDLIKLEQVIFLNWIE